LHPAERARREREIALERIQRQQEAGVLVIRQMTPEERERYGPPKHQPQKRKRGYRLPTHDVRDDA
jgi:hypothetical protein